MLGDLADARTDLWQPTDGDSRPYIALEHIAQGSPRILGHSQASNATSTKAEFRKGDLLFGKLRPNLRKAVLAPFDGVCSTDILVIRARPDCDRGYLECLAHWPPVQEHAVSTASGTKMPRTSWSLLKSCNVLIPPLPEQRKIAAILSSVDETIEKTEAVIAQLDVVKKAMLKELLTRGIPGRHSRFKKTEIGEVPEEWRVVRLGAIASVERGKFSHRPRNDPAFYGGSFPFIQTGDVASCDGVVSRFTQTLNERGLAVSRLFPSGTLVVTIAANIGDSGVLSFDACFPDSLVGITAGSEAMADFLQLVFNLRKEELEAAAPQNAQKNINLQVLTPLMVPLPSYTEQSKIVQSIVSVRLRGEAERHALSALREAKAALAAALLAGTLRVPEPCVA